MSDFTAWIEKNKALWTRVYDEVIVPDMEDEWKKRDQAHRNELKQKEENRQILYTRMEEEMVKNSHLSSENEQLKKQLHLSSTAPISEPDPSHAKEAVETSKSAEEYAHLSDKYKDLSKKFQDLEQQIKYLKRKNSTVMRKNGDMKESVRAWQEYADRQSGKQRPKNESKIEHNQPEIEDTRPHIPSSPTSVATVRTPRFPAGQTYSSPAPTVLLPHPETAYCNSPVSKELHSDQEPKGEARSGSVTPKPVGLSRSSVEQPLNMDDVPSLDMSSTTLSGHVEQRLHSYLQTANPSSSQTTVEESANPSARHIQLANTADDNDIPQFVSARPVNKRKRGQPPKIEVYGDRFDGAPVKPYRVKEEPGSSPPNIYSPVRKETIDLDASTPGVLKTPRHPRHQRSSSAPFSQLVKDEVEPTTLVAHDDPKATSTDIRAISEPTDPIGDTNDVLRHLDPNTVAEPGEDLSNKRMKVADTRDQTAHRIFSESGEEPPLIDENKLRLPPSSARARFNRRIHGPIGSPLPSTSAYQKLSPVVTKIKSEQNSASPQNSSRSTMTPLAKSTLRRQPKENHPVMPTTPANDDRPQWRMKASESRQSSRKPTASLSKNQGRLRLKAVEDLDPQDFKVNPAYNQGYTYAFSETVRKRGDRACLPGCINPQCCGSTFRTLAEAQAPLPSSQEEALLEDYLGEAYDNTRLAHMASGERQELVLQARTAKMAKDTGKHREAYERRRTPPGFWRVDFPSTQELQQDREQAKLSEKELVRERRREAMRKGGKWIFRDE